MKRIFFLALVFLSAQTLAFSQQELMNQLQQPQNVQGHFTQLRYLKSLAKPITTSGQFALVKSKGLLWQMEKPFATQLKVTPSGIQQWNGSRWVSSQKFGQSDQIKLFLGLLSGDISALSEQFDIAVSGEKTQWQLTLTPKTLLMKQIFTQIQLKGDALVQEIELSETQGDRTQIQFSSLKTNQALVTFVQQALEN